MVVDSKVPIRQVALSGARDPNLDPESFASLNSRWYIPRDDVRGVRLARERYLR